MLARLGNVLCWLGCVAAVMILAFVVALWKTGPHQGIDESILVVLAIFGIVVWLIGRACRYILSGI
jgi:hypothetical protein